MHPTYHYYKSIFKNETLPLAFVDLDLLDQNIDHVKHRISNGKTIRVASKSVRSVEILKRILYSDKQVYKGIMCYAISEAVFLSQKGFDDLLVAYPCMQEKQISDACNEIKKGKTIVLMVDSKEHVSRIQSVAKQCNVIVPVCIDIDMSSGFPGLHFGVWRSSVSGKAQIHNLVDYILKNDTVKLDGIMGYEAQIAGVGDKTPGQLLKNKAIQLLKQISQREISQRREAMVQEINKKGISLRFVNGGGTGSIELTCSEKMVTEIAVGSAFYSPALFDYYKDFKHLPAMGFAIEIARIPKQGIYTCHGGGYVASGSPGKEKLPVPYLPEGLKYVENEGAGEVQTPLLYSGNEKLQAGDPVFMRHAKAGELCERFNELHLVSNGKIVERVTTYRGEGQCFL